MLEVTLHRFPPTATTMASCGLLAVQFSMLLTQLRCDCFTARIRPLTVVTSYLPWAILLLKPSPTAGFTWPLKRALKRTDYLMSQRLPAAIASLGQSALTLPFPFGYTSPTPLPYNRPSS